jgi:hypothetical protein
MHELQRTYEASSSGRLQRDYVYLADLWTAADVLRDLPRWFDNCNRVRPGNSTCDISQDAASTALGALLLTSHPEVAPRAARSPAEIGAAETWCVDQRQ